MPSYYEPRCDYDAYRAGMRDHHDQFRPRIFAIDEPESTVYVLVQNGTATHMADWPHPLRALCPEATDGGTLSLSGCRLLPGRGTDLAGDLMAVVDGWVREPGFPEQAMSGWKVKQPDPLL